MKYFINEDIQDQYLKEGSFEIFKHADLICCVQRITLYGNFNGYVAVPEDHILYDKDYSDKVVVKDTKALEFNGNYIGLLCADAEQFESGVVAINLAINVHGGLTYSRNYLCGIDESVFGKLWWFGFDTIHSGDAKGLLSDIDLKYHSLLDSEYRTFEYVKAETIKLAEQLQSI